MRLDDLAHAAVAVWGYGHEGRAALAALRQRFPQKPLGLFCSEAETAGVARDAGLTVVAGMPTAAALGAYDIVIKSPGISPYKPPYPEAKRLGVRYTSGSALWFAEHPHARTICVTGTKGKSTVTALVAHLLRKGGRRVALAGNIGLPLLELLEIGGAAEPDWWVIELSSFQTHDFGGAPSVALINNLYEEHLDWHGTRERYVADKLAIAAKARHLVVNAQQPALLARTATHAQRTGFGDEAGWHVRDDAILRGGERVIALADLPLPGAHNALNVCAALAAIEAAGEDARALAVHAASFKPLPHRLQSLGERNGIAFVNDSIATTPYATIEALRSLAGRRVAVIVGGFDRGLDWNPFVEFVAKHPPFAIVTTGANGAAIAAKLADIAAPAFASTEAPALAEAVSRARAALGGGGTVLLSPGAPSFDAFRDYAERGREFARLAGFDPAAIASIEGLGIA
ncbi:MAG TPA: UDP-N-acetylmuramoyl-L-alanine--D-glutamate ligase [Rudaea sp.]|nr:UDP-N-acetylmuramoyl-L-alanine--D-glutamate ligase [Rudaea sp.]